MVCVELAENLGQGGGIWVCISGCGFSSQCHAEGGGGATKAGVSECEQTQTNADTR